MKLCTSCRDSLQIAVLLLSCSAVVVRCQKTVTGIEGQPISLPCSYKVRQSSDITHMCWGRGSCPNSKCNQELIWTDGHKVTFQSNSRYQLNDNIKQGIVSLTIVQARLEDAGTYCCRIEHAGWFNDEKINIRLAVENAPPTTTTVRTTTPATTTLKSTQAPTTLKTSTLTPVQTTPEPFHIWTTSVEVTTHPPPSIANDTSPPPPPPPPSSTTVSPAGTTESKDLTSRSSGFPTVTTENESREVKPTSDQTTGTSSVPEFMPDHELNSTTESKDKDKDHPTPSVWPQSLSPNNNGISDLFLGNVTAPLKKDTSTIIIAISLSVLALVVICVILLQLKGQKRGRYLLGLDPHLELVTHAEESMTEMQAEEKDSNRAKEDKAETNHIGNMSED